MKTAAKIAVARDNAVLAPRAPNTVPDAPRAEARARLSPFAALKQHEADDRER